MKGRLVVGASVKDVAALAGVSVGTVSNVLNRPEKVSTATAERVRQAIAQLGFARNDAARQLRAGNSRCVGFVVLNVANPFFAQVLHGAEDRAAESGLAVLVGNSAENVTREKAYLEVFREQRLAGVLITPVGSSLELLTGLAESGTPVVLVDREIPGFDGDAVTVDDVQGGWMATRHLIEGGRRRIAFVGGPLSLAQVANRLTGARRAVAEAPGVTLEVLGYAASTVLDGQRAGEVLAARPAHERPDAVFCANDLLALGLMQTLLVGGVTIPGDIALIGYDDIDFAATSIVPLSSIRQPATEIGAAAMELALRSHRDSPRTIRYGPELRVRDSTRG